MNFKNGSCDTIIVGQGLAGSILAWSLHQRGNKVLLISDESAPSASRVAAGLFNPVTGQRFVLQPKAETIIPTAIHFYRKLENALQNRFFYEKPMLRVIRNKREREAITKRAQEPAYAPYLASHTITDRRLHAPFGVVRQQQTGYLDTKMLLDSIRAYFIALHQYLTEPFIYSDLHRMDSGIRWKGIKANRIIFCEGYMGISNPWFNWLPFQPAKGEILHLKSTQNLPDEIINGGKWLLPLHDGSYKTGATYERDITSVETTISGKETLLHAARQLLTIPADFELLDHQAGVRPNTVDKNPYIGMHPDHPEIGIFNGFGSRGSMLIPYYSDKFVSALLDGEPIPSEANIGRYQHG